MSHVNLSAFFVQKGQGADHELSNQLLVLFHGFILSVFSVPDGGAREVPAYSVKFTTVVAVFVNRFTRGKYIFGKGGLQFGGVDFVSYFDVIVLSAGKCP